MQKGQHKAGLFAWFVVLYLIVINQVIEELIEVLN